MRGDVQSLNLEGKLNINQHNTVFRNLGDGTFEALTEDAGLSAQPARRHRGCAFGDLNHEGRVDVVVTALRAPAEIWLNESAAANHWLEL